MNTYRQDVSPQDTHSKVIGYLLWIFGFTGAHRFYYGKPVTGTLLVAVNGIAKISGADFTADFTTGVISFTAAPASGAQVTAGFQFDVPVRFDTDFLDVDYSAFQGGQIPKIPIIEIIP